MLKIRNRTIKNKHFLKKTRKKILGNIKINELQLTAPHYQTLSKKNTSIWFFKHKLDKHLSLVKEKRKIKR